MLITRETDYALRMLRVLLDGEKHSAAEMAETELIPMQFAYQILRKLSAGELVQVSRGAAGGCRLSCDLRGVSLYDLMVVMGEHDVLPLAKRTWEMRHPLPANGAAAKAGRGVPRREPAPAADRRSNSKRGNDPTNVT